MPQFSIAYDPLTVDESVEAATRLRVRSRNTAELDQRIDRVLEETGLSPISDRQVKVLSGGQKRRLGLAMELVSDPKILLCDEVTSGLDPRSEREIVRLLHDLSRKDGRIVLSVTHSLAHLELYDSILVLHEGRVAFHGPPEQLTHYFSVSDTEEVYPRLAIPAVRTLARLLAETPRVLSENARPQPRAADRQRRLCPTAPRRGTAAPEPGAEPDMPTEADRQPADGHETKPRRSPAPAGIFQPVRHAALAPLADLLPRPRPGLPATRHPASVSPSSSRLFSDKASGNIRRFSDTRQTDLFAEIQEQQSVRADQAKVGSAVSGIIMFQVVLLSLMGSNNSAREIAGERPIYEKEKFGGLRPSAYLASKVAFLACLVITQSLWMAFFVNFFGTFRGDFIQHAGFLLLVNAAMTSICLAISALMRTAEQASLLSIYLVGFQLPLSGAVLALPEKIEAFTRPFISAYWAWSGSVEALQTQVHDAVKSVIDTGLSAQNACLYALGAHIGVALIAAWAGACRPQWD